ncbi:Lethal(2)neighbour of Tid protein, partial [Trichodelitschia bisporula]
MTTYVKTVIRLARDPEQARWLAPLLLAIDAVLCAGIIAKVPYTEIDWKAYMQQVRLYIDGERTYTKLVGDTGPLVYPGLHVYLYRFLHAVTNGGENILAAQVIFAGFYLAALAVVMRCYWKAKAPPYIYPLLILSKRQHSIFLLRLFNDGPTVLLTWSALAAYQSAHWSLGTALYSAAIGTKMSALLPAPALALTMLQTLGLSRCVTQALLIAQTQSLFAYEFVRTDWRAYVGRAFELSRVFLYRWTVNWRFVPEDVFLSKPFAASLLAAHAALLLLFAATRWTRPSRLSLLDTLKLHLRHPDTWAATQAAAARADPAFVLTAALTANAIGMLCARSLHYQFYAWGVWGAPWLIWKAGLGPGVWVVWAVQEGAWNVYPATEMSSMVVVGGLAVQVLGVWWGTREGEEG